LRLGIGTALVGTELGAARSASSLSRAGRGCSRKPAHRTPVPPVL